MSVSTVEGYTEDDFYREVNKVLGGVAKEKGYLDPNSLENPLMDFMNTTFPDHALGEIIYKAVRYKSKKDPLDLIKIAAWSKLIYEWRDK